MMLEQMLGFLRFIALLAQIGFGVWLFSSRLPIRPHGRLWAALVFAAFFIFLAILFPHVPEEVEDGESLQMQLIIFSAFLITCVGMVFAHRSADPLTALFCATAGYTTQNLASGLDGLVKLLALEIWGVPEGDLRLWVPSFVICSLIVFIPVYRMFVKRIRTVDLECIQHKGMVGTLIVVMFAVILFDIVNKSLPGFDVPLAVTCISRIIHGIVCIFVLYAEYEMVFNRALELEVAATEKILDERGRQYELSREAISSVNRRVHDIRHQIARRLDGAKIESSVLSEVIRAVDIYDSNLRTGNEALDTVLAEKSLAARRAGITLTCIADGTALSPMAATDVFTLVGTMLDLAFEAVRNLDNEEYATISLSVRPSGEIAAVHVECFCPDGWQADMAILDRIVERYGGLDSSSIDEGILSLDVAIPL